MDDGGMDPRAFYLFALGIIAGVYIAAMLRERHDPYAGLVIGAPPRPRLPVGHALELPETFDSPFKCPECGGTYFGSVLEGVEILERECHDQFGVGCRWRGPDSACMTPRPPRLLAINPVRKS